MKRIYSLSICFLCFTTLLSIPTYAAYGGDNSNIFIWLLAFAITLGIAIALAFIPANIASKKGYSKVGFWFFGFFLWLIALIVALCLDNKSNNNMDAANALSKYKDLYDEGVITKEEFEIQKQKLLK